MEKFENVSDYVNYMIKTEKLTQEEIDEKLRLYQLGIDGKEDGKNGV